VTRHCSFEHKASNDTANVCSDKKDMWGNKQAKDLYALRDKALMAYRNVAGYVMGVITIVSERRLK
jgi:hypothetical protein